jgi:hypothetical protein
MLEHMFDDTCSEINDRENELTSTSKLVPPWAWLQIVRTTFEAVPAKYIDQQMRSTATIILSGKINEVDMIVF